jgi:hypothetical protein
MRSVVSVANDESRLLRTSWFLKSIPDEVEDEWKTGWSSTLLEQRHATHVAGFVEPVKRLEPDSTRMGDPSRDPTTAV